MKVSVVMPVFNEKNTIKEILKRVRAAPVDDKEIICIDDGSTDGTWNILQEEAQKKDIKLLRHTHNMGKGAAVRIGLEQVKGDVVIIQDADLEYDPEDYPKLLKPILSGKSKVVYGSRFLGEHKAMYFWHAVGNNFLTLLVNVLFDTTLTDMETCYKVFTADITKRLELNSPGWGFDPEITAKILKMGHRIYEVPISYTGREHLEGKKIRWTDAITVIFTILRYRFFD